MGVRFEGRGRLGSGSGLGLGRLGLGSRGFGHASSTKCNGGDGEDGNELGEHS